MHRLGGHRLKYVPMFDYFAVFETENIDTSKPVGRVGIDFIGWGEDMMNVQYHIIPIREHALKQQLTIWILCYPHLDIPDKALLIIGDSGIVLPVIIPNVQPKRLLRIFFLKSCLIKTKYYLFLS